MFCICKALLVKTLSLPCPCLPLLWIVKVTHRKLFVRKWKNTPWLFTCPQRYRNCYSSFPNKRYRNNKSHWKTWVPKSRQLKSEDQDLVPKVHTQPFTIHLHFPWIQVDLDITDLFRKHIVLFSIQQSSRFERNNSHVKSP